jgi:hypothetical protein
MSLKADLLVLFGKICCKISEKKIYIKGDNSTKKTRWPPRKRPFFHG